MKTFRTILFAALTLCAAMTVSCSKENSMPVQDQQGTISVEVNGILGEYSTVDDTKAGLASNIRVKWAAGDMVYAFDGATCLGSLTVSLKDGKDYYAVLSGELSVPQAGTEKISLVYSNAFSAVPAKDAAAADVTIDLTSQTASDSPDNVKFAVSGTLDYSSGTPAICNEVVDFNPATSIIRLNCSGLEASTAITSATLKGAGNKCKLTFAKAAAPAVSGMTDADIALSCSSEFTANAKGTKTIYVAIAPNTAITEQVFKAVQGKNYKCSLGNNVFSAAKSINAVCPMWCPSDGVLSGNFSVSSTKQVQFSRGNLRATYNGSEYTWGFAYNQYDYIGNASGNTTIDSQTSGAVVDLFGWSTTSTYFGISTSLLGGYSGDFVNWGKIIGDGSTWRTLTEREWSYLLKTRTNASSLCKDHVSVCGKDNCVIVAPDDFVGTIADSYDASSWLTAEAAGLICLPPAGCRQGYTLYDVGKFGFYWSSSASGVTKAYNVFFSNMATPNTDIALRHYGSAVRLVTDVE